MCSLALLLLLSQPVLAHWRPPLPALPSLLPIPIGPGPRLVDGVEMLAKLLYPSAEISTPSTWEKRALKLEPCAPGDAATARDAAALAARFVPCFAERRESASADDEPTVDASDPWAGDVPLTADELEPDDRTRAETSKLPLALAKAVHRRAVSLGRNAYIDPQSGFSVFTAHYLKRRPCCGNGCRHCPWGHANVGRKDDKLARPAESAGAIDW